jgi:LPS export ABC transporter permease LptF/LPS export ABC transporter permease LptG
MRLLDRYIGREVASHAALGLAVFTFVFFVPQLVHLMELVVRHSGGAGTVSLLFLSTLPPVLVFTIPMAVLVGVLIGLGRLSSDSEIVALHASGISLRRLLVPIGFVALLSAFATLLITFWLSPSSLRTLRRLQSKVLSSQIPFAVQPRVFDERFPHFVLYVQDVGAAATQWRGVFLASSSGPGGTSITVAKDALVVSGPEANQLELHLGAGSTQEYDPRYPDRYNVTTFGDSDIPVDISGAASAPKNSSTTEAEKYVSALLADRGPTWLDSRVELENRVAFPAACLVFALLGVPIGVRPRRGGRAAGMILTLVLIGSYYFLWITGDHMARQGRISPWAGVWAANFTAALLGVFFFLRIESPRKIRIFDWFERYWIRLRRAPIGKPSVAAVPISNGPVAPSSTALAAVANGPIGASSTSLAATSNPLIPSDEPPALNRRIRQAWSAVRFPMMIDIYLLGEFFYYFCVVLAGFLLIFDAFTLFELLGDISKNHVSFLIVLNYFRFLVPFLVYQLAPLATLVATLVTLAVLAKNNEVIAFKASGISLYRLILPLTLAGCLLAGGMFLLDNTFLPYANQRQDALRNEIKGRPAQTYIEPARQWIFGENDKIYNYELFDSDRQLFGGLNVFELDPATFRVRRRVFATRAVWEPTENAWVLTGGWVREFASDGHVSSFYPFKVFSLAELTEPPSYFRREVHQYYQMTWRQLGQYIASLRQAGFDIARLSVQWQKKFALPLIAPIIVFLGAPFALLVGTRGAIGGLAVAVGISVVYWATAALFEAMGSIGQLPPFLAAWAPDAIFGFLAVYFFLRMPT